MIALRCVTPSPRPALTAEIAALASRLAAERLGQDPGATAALVELADPAAWFITDRRPTDDGRAAFWLDAKVTTGTNTKAETTAFVRAAFDGMGVLPGAVHEESYVLAHAADGHTYDNGGRTHEGRWAAANPG